MYKLLLFCIVLIFILSQEHLIEGFIGNINQDDLIFNTVSDKKTKDHQYLLTNYHITTQPEYELGDGLLSTMYDILGYEDHSYLFSSPHLKPDPDYKFNKKYTSFIGGYPDLKYHDYKKYGHKKYKGRPITMPDRTFRKDYNKFTEQLDHQMINKPFYPYRHPKDLATKYVYDFSDSIDMEKELEKRRIRLMGFRRSTLDEQNDYTSMTFCSDIDEEGTPYDCSKYGLETNPDAYSKLARDDEYSSHHCCKSQL